MPQVQLAGNGLGGVFYGNYGVYQAAVDGTFTVDTRDAPSMIAGGATYLRKAGVNYTVPKAAAAATAGQIVASAALANGALTIANQPDVQRQVAMRVDPGTVAITAGVMSVTYTGNDGQSTTDVIPLKTAASTLLTKFLSKGVVSLSTPVISALAGGASPAIQLDTTAALSVPVDPGAVDFTEFYEAVAGTAETLGTVSTVTLGTITPSNAPNATRVFNFGFNYVSPVV